MMSNEYQERLDQVDDYLLGNLSEKEVEEFEIFLFGSPELLEEVKIREQMLRLIKSERRVLLTDFEESKFSSLFVSIKVFFFQPQPRWVYATVALILIAAILIPSLLFVERDPAFAVNESLEAYLGEAHRSVGIFSEFKIISPEIGQKFDRKVLFQWTIKSDGQPYEETLHLKVLNNREEVVQDQSINGISFRSIEISQPGLYYWTLEHKGEMLYLGKFIVKSRD
jgi:hypothetical protein